MFDSVKDKLPVMLNVIIGVLEMLAIGYAGHTGVTIFLSRGDCLQAVVLTLISSVLATIAGCALFMKSPRPQYSVLLCVILAFLAAVVWTIPMFAVWNVGLKLLIVL